MEVGRVRSQNSLCSLPPDIAALTETELVVACHRVLAILALCADQPDRASPLALPGAAILSLSDLRVH